MRSIVYSDAAPTSLLEGVEGAVSEVLRVRSLRHRSALLELGERSELPVGALRAAYDQIQRNWQACSDRGLSRPSTQNWRWRMPQLAIAAHNRSPEVVLERALIGAAERASRTDWSNQVPVASGVAGSSAERRRAIDLVCKREPGWFQFIELKIASDTPLYAAIEILSYLCIWLVSRHPDAERELLAADRIDAIVLAPKSYYRRFLLAALSERLDAEAEALGADHNVHLSFAFQSFPDELARAPFTDAGLLAVLDERKRL